MVDKLQFNNLVISNKNSIRQGRTQTINKLVQKIRKIKALLDKQPESEKTKSRLRKATEIINHLKKLKPIDIIKNVLLLERGPDAVITDGLSSPEETGVALLALNKTIRNLVKRFKEYLNLTDSSHKWKEELMEISKRRNKKNKTELKKIRRKDVKEQKVIARKRLEWIKENNPDSVVKQEMDLCNKQEVITNVGQWKIESIDEVSFASPVKVSQSEKSLELQKKKQYRAENACVVKKLPILRKTNKNEGRQSPSESTAVVTHIPDPFFFTETGENYLSSATINQDQQNLGIAKAENTITLRHIKKKDRCSNSSTVYHRKNIDGTVQREHSKFWNKELHPSWVAKRQKSFVPEFQGKKISFDINENSQDSEYRKINKNEKYKNELEKLHPSWIAKQKMKSNITTFQGKKLSFTDNSDEN